MAACTPLQYIQCSSLLSFMFDIVLCMSITSLWEEITDCFSLNVSLLSHMCVSLFVYVLIVFAHNAMLYQYSIAICNS